MSDHEGPPPGRRRPQGRRLVAIEVAIIMLIPVILGAVLGWFELNPVQAEQFSTVGSEAHELLSGFPDSRLVVEIDYQASIGPPPQSALSTLEQQLNITCTKTSISVQEHPFTSSRSSYTESDLWALETSVRQNWPAPGTMALSYLYLDGSDASDASAIGLAYRGSSISVFEATIRATSSGSPSPGVDATVMVHELGHELGLVGIVGSAPNEDPNHPYHSNDPNDVMFWAVDSTALILGGLLGGGSPPTQFGSADLNDLNTVRSTPIPLELIPPIGTGLVLFAVVIIAIRARKRRRNPSSGPE